MANYSLVLGVSKGEAEVIGNPIANGGAKRLFKQIIADNGIAGVCQYEEVWLVDTLQGRLRRKGFVCGSAPQADSAEPAKRRGRPPKATV
jgi:hypothetical protein